MGLEPWEDVYAPNMTNNKNIKRKELQNKKEQGMSKTLIEKNFSQPKKQNSTSPLKADYMDKISLYYHYMRLIKK